MLPTETAGERDEIEFGRRLMYLGTAWIVATIAVGVLMVIAAPWMQGMF